MGLGLVSRGIVCLCSGVGHGEVWDADAWSELGELYSDVGCVGVGMYCGGKFGKVGFWDGLVDHHEWQSVRWFVWAWRWVWLRARFWLLGGQGLWRRCHGSVLSIVGSWAGDVFALRMVGMVRAGESGDGADM